MTLDFASKFKVKFPLRSKNEMFQSLKLHYRLHGWAVEASRQGKHKPGNVLESIFNRLNPCDDNVEAVEHPEAPQGVGMGHE